MSTAEEVTQPKVPGRPGFYLSEKDSETCHLPWIVEEALAKVILAKGVQRDLLSSHLFMYREGTRAPW